jgi:hypothetical protein
MSGGMLIPPGPIRVLVATKPVDFRKGMDGDLLPEDTLEFGLESVLRGDGHATEQVF